MYLAFAASIISTAAACSAEPPTEVEGDTANADLAECEAAPGTRDVTLNLASDVQDLKCSAMMGSFVTFTWENLFYAAWVSDDPVVCRTKLEALRSSGAVHATVRDIQTIHAKRVFVTSELTLDEAGGPFALRASRCSR
jgi:hypothetical protein